jgi:hypothetical protein
MCILRIWHRISSLNSEVPTTCKVTAVLKAGHTVVGVPLGRREAHTEISGQKIADAFWKAEGPDIPIKSTSRRRKDLHQSLTHIGQVSFDGHPAAIIFEFRPSHTVCIGIEYVVVE